MDKEELLKDKDELLVHLYRIQGAIGYIDGKLKEAAETESKNG